MLPISKALKWPQHSSQVWRRKSSSLLSGAVTGTATCIQYALASRPSMAKWKLGAGGRFSEAGNCPEASGRQHAPKCRVMEAWPAIFPQRLHFPIDCCLLMAEHYIMRHKWKHLRFGCVLTK